VHLNSGRTPSQIAAHFGVDLETITEDMARAGLREPS
jgi:hypothetical protein